MLILLKKKKKRQERPETFFASSNSNSLTLPLENSRNCLPRRKFSPKNIEDRDQTRFVAGVKNDRKRHEGCETFERVLRTHK